jgi:hypothetical protein
MEAKVSESDVQIIAAMERFGGGFVKALAAAAGKADPQNLDRLKLAWPEYWAEYAEMARNAAFRAVPALREARP